ncbi:uncharacterized protein F4812DRAFT_319074 [Daldinia caldariorum]|uniref:uncharacterized protein n=1 Tax=Daldinia caldariorum TaxID=326644 RepID=UPI0020075607|nr:uncharacterized protein F4812DRAFT_319074 [Daldinia caldariorum]KAI1469088.1 hypothetical protein F4812DRAFT_319074 [Daldinia caldariorum]
MGKTEMSKSDSSRIQASQARGGGDMSSKGFASRAQAAGDRHQSAASGGQGSAASGGQQTAGYGGSGSNTGGSKGSK